MRRRGEMRSGVDHADHVAGAAPKRRRHRLRRALAVAALVVVALLVAARVALTPFVESRLRHSLANMKGMRGTFSHLDLSILHLSFALHDVRVEKLSAAGKATPYFQAARAEIGLYWTQLAHGQLVGAAELDRPKISLVSSPRPGERQEVGEAPQLGKKLQEIAPLRLDRFEVKDGEVLWIDAHVPERPRLWLHGIAGTLENFATRAALARGEPSVLAVSGTLQRTGQLSLFASADPLAKGLTFAGQGRLQGLRLDELGELLAATAGITPSRGSLDMELRFKCVDGHLTGGVRPILKNADVQQAKPGFENALKAFLADAAIKLLSDRVPGRNAVATTIPIQGEVQNPQAQTWPTVLGVVRNAFVTGLAESLANLPPKGSGEDAKHEPQARRGDGSHPATDDDRGGKAP
jgi:hypothetical protein